MLYINLIRIQTSSSGVVRVKQKSKSKSFGTRSLSLFLTACSPLFTIAKAATSRPKQSKKTTTDEMEVDDIEMTPLEGMSHLLILFRHVNFVESTG